jgi:hypothetical protein
MNPDLQIPDLLRQLRDDTTTLVREEVSLAKTEITEKLTTASRNAAYLAVGITIASSALLLVLMGASYLLSQAFVSRGMESGTATSLGFLVVAVVVGVISTSLILKALKTFKSDSLKPERTVQSLREDRQWAQNKMS